MSAVEVKKRFSQGYCIIALFVGKIWQPFQILLSLLIMREDWLLAIKRVSFNSNFYSENAKSSKITTQILNPNSFLTKLNPCSQTSNPILINWGKWGACTEKCGACGVQYRYLMQNGKQIRWNKFIIILSTISFRFHGQKIEIHSYYHHYYFSSPKFGSPQSKICNTQPCESSGVLKSRSDLYVTNGRLKKFFIFFLIDFWTFLFFN